MDKRLARLIEEQRQDDTPGQDPEPFVDLHLDAMPEGLETVTLRMTYHREWLLSCPLHPSEVYCTDQGQRRCRECDRDSRRRSYRKAMRDPARKAAERKRQREWRAKNREAYNARARERYRERKREQREEKG